MMLARNAIWAVLGWELSGVSCIAWRKSLAVSETTVTCRDSVGCLGHGIIGHHPEAGLGGRHFAVFFRAVRHVIHCHPAILLQTAVGILGHALTSAVVWRFEI